MTSKDTQGRVREAKKGLYRSLILDAAEEVFAEHGFDSAKVQEIAKRAGVSLATLYGVFPKKVGMLTALHERRLTELLGLIGGVLPKENPLDQLRGGYDTYLTYHMAHPNYLKMHLFEGSAWALQDTLRTDEQTRAWLFGLEGAMLLIREGIARGMIMEEDPELLARTVAAMHQVRLALWVKAGMVQQVEEVTRAADRQLVRTLCPPDLVRDLLGEAPAQAVSPARKKKKSTATKAAGKTGPSGGTGE